MRSPRDIREVQTAAKKAANLRDRLEGRDINLKGHRVTGAAPSKHQNDYITRQELGVAITNQSEQIVQLWRVVHDLQERIWKLENP